MTDETTPELSDELVALLGDDAVWAELDASVTDAAVAAVMADVETGRSSSAGTPAAPSDPPVAPSAPLPPPVVDLASRRRTNWSSALLGAAAALVLAVAGFVVLNVVSGTGDGDTDVQLALEPTEREPGASGSVELTATPNGTRIMIETTGLPPAPDGTYYEAWLRTGPDFGVSAGTFHLRGGGDVTIELWAGVSIEDFPLFTVTVQPVGMAESSGEVVLLARLDG